MKGHARFLGLHLNPMNSEKSIISENKRTQTSVIFGTICLKLRSNYGIEITYDGQCTYSDTRLFL